MDSGTVANRSAFRLKPYFTDRVAVGGMEKVGQAEITMCGVSPSNKPLRLI